MTAWQAHLPMLGTNMPPTDGGARLSSRMATHDSDEHSVATFDLSQTRLAALQATTVDERVRALQLLSATPDAESADTLATALLRANDPVERATAVISLRQQLQDNSEDPRVLNALHTAEQDQDPLVVVLAQTALEQAEPGP